MHYIRSARKYSTYDVLKELQSRGYLADISGCAEYDLFFKVPADPHVYTVRHMSRNKFTDLVVRGVPPDFKMLFIPTCHTYCQGCHRCVMAGLLNGETSAEARKRRHEPSTHYKVGPRRLHRRKKIKEACADAQIDVYSQLEDID